MTWDPSVAVDAMEIERTLISKVSSWSYLWYAMLGYQRLRIRCSDDGVLHFKILQHVFAD
jgi:hypothetical protein